MPYNTTVTRQQEVYLTSEIKSHVIDKNTDFPELSFTVNYNEDLIEYQNGYPKTNSSSIYKLVENELLRMGIYLNYKPYKNVDPVDISVDVIYVNHEIKNSMKEEDLELCKVKRIQVPIKKRKMLRSVLQ